MCHALHEARDLLSKLKQIGTCQELQTAAEIADWPDLLTSRIQGYRQVTDAMLIATAFSTDTVLTTLNKKGFSIWWMTSTETLSFRRPCCS